MATVSGIGTMRYDWKHRSDGTAEATLWFVIFFFPIIPLRRENLRVVDLGIERSNIGSILLAIQGVEDQYGTDAQIASIAKGAGGKTETLLLRGCRHTPHAEKEKATLEAMARFIRSCL